MTGSRSIASASRAVRSPTVRGRVARCSRSRCSPCAASPRAPVSRAGSPRRCTARRTSCRELLLVQPGARLAEGDAIARDADGREVARAARRPAARPLGGRRQRAGGAARRGGAGHRPRPRAACARSTRGWITLEVPGRCRARRRRHRRRGPRRAGDRGARRRTRSCAPRAIDVGATGKIVVGGLAGVGRDADPGAGHGRGGHRPGRRAGQGAARLRGDPAPPARDRRPDRLASAWCCWRASARSGSTRSASPGSARTPAAWRACSARRACSSSTMRRPPPAAATLPRVGERVIAHRRPFQGRAGVLVAELEDLHAAPSGIPTRMGLVRFEDGRLAPVPLANLEATLPVAAARLRPVSCLVMEGPMTAPAVAGVLTTHAAAETRALGAALGAAAAPGDGAGADRPARRRQDAAGQGRGRGARRAQRGEQPDLRADERARRAAAPLPHRRLSARRPGGGACRRPPRRARGRRRDRRRMGRSARRLAAARAAGPRDRPWTRPATKSDRTIAWRAHGAAHAELAARSLEPAMIIALETASTDISLALATAGRQPGGRRTAGPPTVARVTKPLPRLLRAAGAQRDPAWREASALAVGRRPGLVHRPAGGDEPGQGPGPGARTARSSASRAWRPGWRPSRTPAAAVARAGAREAYLLLRGERSRASWTATRCPSGRRRAAGGARRSWPRRSACERGHRPTGPRRPIAAAAAERLRQRPGGRRPRPPGARLPPRAARHRPGRRTRRSR